MCRVYELASRALSSNCLSSRKLRMTARDRDVYRDIRRHGFVKAEIPLSNVPIVTECAFINMREYIESVLCK